MFSFFFLIIFVSLFLSFTHVSQIRGHRFPLAFILYMYILDHWKMYALGVIVKNHLTLLDMISRPASASFYIINVQYSIVPVIGLTLLLPGV